MTLREIQLAELDILADIDRFCRDRGLRYCLWCGSLIGAVRHKGFIPWDDDIDIAMPRPDYERFVKEYVSKKYRCIGPHTHAHYPYTFVRVDDPTTRIELPHNKFNDTGLCVDVMPLDGMTDDVETQKSIRRKVLRLQRIKLIKNRVLHFRLQILHHYLIQALVPWKFLNIGMKKLTQNYPFESSPCFVALQYPSFSIDNMTWPTSALLPLIEADFEGRKFFIPHGYDTILRQRYGDYMTPPPHDNGKAYHNYKIYRV